MDKNKKVVVAGHICIDITPVFPKRETKRVEALLSPGKLIRMEGVDIHTGGCVANTGLAMKLLGVDAELMGKVGQDALGRLIMDSLKAYGAEKGMICSPDAATSYSIVLAIPGLDRIFLHRSGANDTFSCEDIDFKIIREASLFHFGYPPIMKKMYREQGEELVKLLEKVKEQGVPVSLDMAAVDPDSDAAQADWDGILSRALPCVDFFVPSAEELCFMMDRSRYGEWTERARGKEITQVLRPEDVRPLADKALKYGAKAVLIKCGAPGIYYKTASPDTIRGLCERLSLPLIKWADQEGFEAGYLPDRVLSATGAGDSSIAAFLACVVNGASLEEAVRMAAAEGASCVAAYDALSGLKPLKELRERIEKGWEKRGPETEGSQRG